MHGNELFLAANDRFKNIEIFSLIPDVSLSDSSSG